MERLKRVGKVRAKRSSEIGCSKISLGFEKLDRAVFDPEKAYDKVADCGVKKVRIQSGWARTEKEKGKYDFAWLDDIVNNFFRRGIEPWMCLCYGNPLYNDEAKKVFGAVGCLPVSSEEEKTAWLAYVKATVVRYKGKVTYFEIWNEPDGEWKHSLTGEEYGNFALQTAKAIKQANPQAQTIGGAVCKTSLKFLAAALKTGMGEYLDYVSFHEYTRDERTVFTKVEALTALVREYDPKIRLIQGESGSQSRSGGHGALHLGAWTEEIQAKQLARHTIADLISDVHFTSYFSCVDMVEALNGTVGDKNSYLDYGYFGILGAEFDENGNSTGEYYKKPSYYVLQNICSVFAEEMGKTTVPFYVRTDYTDRKYERQPSRNDIVWGAFERKGGKAFAYWYPTNIMTTSFCSSITLEIFSEYAEWKLVDIMDGSIYEIPQSMIEDLGNGVYLLKELPIKDTPLLLIMGRFLV